MRVLCNGGVLCYVLYDVCCMLGAVVSTLCAVCYVLCSETCVLYVVHFVCCVLCMLCVVCKTHLLSQEN
jgi:hypothetical protein